VIEKQEKKTEKMQNQSNFLLKSPCNRWSRNEIHSLLKRADATGSADIINVCDAYWATFIHR